MDRRYFLKTGLTAGAGLGIPGSLKGMMTEKKKKKQKILSAYYFRAHMYTMVPRHVREDMQWMAEAGTDTVCVAVLEQDLRAAVENIVLISEEAARVGMEVYAVPARWGGMFAGAPKVPSLFSATNPHTWVLNEDGTSYNTNVSGVVSSIHYPETFEFFCNSLDKMFELWDISGVVWDEPKSFEFGKDYSPKAIEKLGREAPFEKHIEATIDFYSRVNGYIKRNYPGIFTHMFAYAFMEDQIIEAAAGIKDLDYLGCDGRPWAREDDTIGTDRLSSRNKVLLGAGERYLKAARQQGKGTLWLVENHNLKSQYIPLMERRLPEIITKDVDHLLYYYYPRNLQDPEKTMAVIAKNIKNFKS